MLCQDVMAIPPTIRARPMKPTRVPDAIEGFGFTTLGVAPLFRFDVPRSNQLDPAGLFPIHEVLELGL
jgi:hypothetical protein